MIETTQLFVVMRIHSLAQFHFCTSEYVQMLDEAYVQLVCIDSIFVECFRRSWLACERPGNKGDVFVNQCLENKHCIRTHTYAHGIVRSMTNPKM